MMERKIRLFTALIVPDDLKKTIANLPQQKIEGAWTHPDDLHITIRFLGDVPVYRLESIQEVLSRVRRPPFNLCVRGLNVFENRRQAILYADVESTRKLTTLCADMTDRLTPLGFDFGTRPFVPHMTLARLKNHRNPDDFIRKHGRDVVAHWTVSGFHLFQSSAPDAQNRRYTSLCEYRLF